MYGVGVPASSNLHLPSHHDLVHVAEIVAMDTCTTVSNVVGMIGTEAGLSVQTGMLHRVLDVLAQQIMLCGLASRRAWAVWPAVRHEYFPDGGGESLLGCLGCTLWMHLLLRYYVCTRTRGPRTLQLYAAPLSLDNWDERVWKVIAVHHYGTVYWPTGDEYPPASGGLTKPDGNSAAWSDKADSERMGSTAPARGVSGEHHESSFAEKSRSSHCVEPAGNRRPMVFYHCQLVKRTAETSHSHEREAAFVQREVPSGEGNANCRNRSDAPL
ncbi:hypothetical protein BGY98DRAFT_935996 [Russula aff. rugulosa BPL654]|nr:hypothetical protein BGY98DRAFT_935996 [Russula aff. rugulosa BPL654]